MKQIDLKVLKEIIDYLSDDVVIFLATKDDCVKQKQSELDENTLYLNNPFGPIDGNIVKPCSNKKSESLRNFHKNENKVPTIPVYGIEEITNQRQLINEIDSILNKPSKLISNTNGK